MIDEYNQLGLTHICCHRALTVKHTLYLCCIMLHSIKLATRKQSKTEHMTSSHRLWTFNKTQVHNDTGTLHGEAEWTCGKKWLFQFIPFTRWGKEEGPSPNQVSSFWNAFPVPTAPTDSISAFSGSQTDLPSSASSTVAGEALPHESHQMKRVPFSKSNTSRVVKLNPTI